MIRLACLSIGYLIGCIQTAYLTGKKKANIDIRDFGSGNAGTTNIARQLGFKTGVFVFVVDVLKAVLAFFLCSYVFAFTGIDPLLLGLYAGAGVILGHNFPIFFNFRGGKGIACSLGVILCVDWRAALVIYAIGIILVLLMRYISLASIVMLALFPISTLVLNRSTEIIILATLFSALAIFQHRGNIKRLVSGTERKVTLKLKKKSEKHIEKIEDEKHTEKMDEKLTEKIEDEKLAEKIEDEKHTEKMEDEKHADES